MNFENGGSHNNSLPVEVSDLKIAMFLTKTSNILSKELEDRILILRDSQGNPTLLEKYGNRIVRQISIEGLIGRITKIFLSYNLRFYKTKIRESLEHYFNSLNDIHEIPAAIALKDDPCLAFNRIDFSPSNNKTPIFDELLSRCTNGEAFQAFLWSLFEPQADRQQYLWLYGEGGNGKSSISRFLERLMGGAYCAAQAVGASSDKHYTANFIGKRLAVYSDTNAFGFVRSGLFKELSGNDPVCINQKYAQPFTVRLDVKFLFLSNGLPVLSSQKADLRRAIVCKLAALSCDPDPDYEEKLWAERAGILHKCLQQYQLLAKRNGPILCDTNILEDLAEDSESEFQYVLEESLVVAPEFEMTPDNLYRSTLMACKEVGVKPGEFKKWLFRKYNLKETRSVANDNKRIFFGFRSKHFPDPTIQPTTSKDKSKQ